MMEQKGQSRELGHLKNTPPWGAKMDNCRLSEIHVISPPLSGVESYREWQEKEVRQLIESKLDFSPDIN